MTQNLDIKELLLAAIVLLLAYLAITVTVIGRKIIEYLGMDRAR